MFCAARNILIKEFSNLEEQSGVCPNVILIWKNLIMKIDKESLLLENDRICLRPLSIVDDHISRLSDLKAIRVLYLLVGEL